MTVKIDGTNTVANPAFTGADTDTGLQCGTNELKLVTGGSARATVDSSGNLGVGTESPSRLLTVQSTGNANLCIKSGTSGVSQCMFGDTDSDVAGNIAYRHSDNAMVFEVNLSERARILSGGGLTFNGDTAQANALDDYEEGEWVPTVVGSTGGTATLNAAVETLSYTKIGRQVTISGRINITSVSGLTGSLQITNFPFPNISTTDDADYGLMHITAHGFDFPSDAQGSVLFLELSPSATAGTIFYLRDDASWTPPAISAFDATTANLYIHVNGTYMTS